MDLVESSSILFTDLPDVLLQSFVAFGTIYDHAKLEACSKLLNQTVKIYYQRQSDFNYIQHYLAHHGLTKEPKDLSVREFALCAHRYLNYKSTALIDTDSNNDLIAQLIINNNIDYNTFTKMESFSQMLCESAGLGQERADRLQQQLRALTSAQAYIILLKLSITSSMTRWLSNKLVNIKQLAMNNHITEKQLSILLDNKPKLKSLDISPIYQHTNLSNKFLMNIMRSHPNLELFRVVGCNCIELDRAKYKDQWESISTIEEETGCKLQRVPDGYPGDWITFDDNLFERGELHRWFINGTFKFDGDEQQEKGILTSVGYCKGYNLLSKEPVIKYEYWDIGWNANEMMEIGLVARRYRLSKPELDELKEDEDIKDVIEREYGIKKLQENKWHWESMEIAQKSPDEGVFTEWPEDVEEAWHHGVWVKVVFD